MSLRLLKDTDCKLLKSNNPKNDNCTIRGLRKKVYLVEFKNGSWGWYRRNRLQPLPPKPIKIQKVPSQAKIQIIHPKQQSVKNLISSIETKNTEKIIPQKISKPIEPPSKEEIKFEKDSKEREEFHDKHFTSINDLNTKEFEEKKQKAKKYTKEILSKPCDGNLSNRHTLLHILSGYSKSQGTDITFSEDQNNNNSKFIGGLGSTKTQNAVLKLDNLDDLIDNEKFEDTKEQEEPETKEKKLKKQILDIRDCIKNNKKNDIIENMKNKLGKVHNVDPKYIVINDVYYGSAHIDYSIITSFSKKGNVTDALKQQFKSYKDLKLHPLFFEENFNINDFDERGNKVFSQGQTFDIGPPNRKQKYHQPTGWTRYGLKVLDGRYGNDHNWLANFGNDNSWYRAYHGTAPRFGQLIVEGPNKPNQNQNQAFFKPGSGQACAGHQAIGGGLVGLGVYCSNIPTTAEGYCKEIVTINTTQGQKKYKFMFQVCVDPNRIKMSASSAGYWVVPTGQYDAIRPYGILLKET